MTSPLAALPDPDDSPTDRRAAPRPSAADRLAARQGRRRNRVRSEIAAAAERLVIEHGFDSTTVRRIADAAEVADRTFYRYFASKEAALLHPLSMFVDDFVAATRVHLERVDPLRSMLSAVDDLQAVGHYDDSMAFLVRSVASHPSLAGEYHNELLRGESALTVSFAEHLGVAPQAHTPRLLAAAGTMALTAAITTWQADPSVDVWELGRVGLRHAATGLDLLARAPGHGAPRS